MCADNDDENLSKHISWARRSISFNLIKYIVSHITRMKWQNSLRIWEITGISFPPHWMLAPCTTMRILTFPAVLNSIICAGRSNRQRTHKQGAQVAQQGLSWAWHCTPTWNCTFWRLLCVFFFALAIDFFFNHHFKLNLNRKNHLPGFPH